jgi:NAD(P)-dependent dehydrogenase (short-subunit alcohol dehydrogenase family)
VSWERAMLGPEAFDLSAKRALVMGAGWSVGRAIALALAEAGADVAVSSVTEDDKEVATVKSTAREIADMGRRTLEQAVDATVGTGAGVVLRRVVEVMGGVDILVSAPDLFLGKPVGQISDAEWTRVLNLNLSATFYACRAAGEEMLKQEYGRIINVASALGERGLANSAAYCAAHGGGFILTRALAQEWGPYGITVNGIAPAWLEDTPGLGDPRPEANRTVRFIPMRRAGRPDEVGPLAVWLASDASGYVTGQIFFVDGGLLCHL